MTEVELDLSILVCRLCLSEENPMEEVSLDDGLMVFECTTIKLQKIDMPQFICVVCRSKLKLWYKFKQKCLKTDEILKQRYPGIFSDENEEKGGPFETRMEKSNEIEPEENRSDVDDEEYVEIYNEVCSEEEDEIVSNDENAIGREQSEEEENEFTTEVLNIEVEKLENDHAETESKIDQSIESTKHETMADFKGGPPSKIYGKCCTICGKFKRNINSHMSIHSDKMPFKCSYCGKCFRQKSNYKHHLNIHTGEKPYECKVCLQKFADPTGLRSHMIRHTGKRDYHCEICGKSFLYSHSLSQHHRIHTQDRQHSCEYCNKSFLSKHSLIKHIRIHTGEKPYKCDKCSKCFTTSGNLSVHKRVHTKERPYECELCDKKFSYRSVLSNHMKKHERIQSPSIVVDNEKYVLELIEDENDNDDD